MNESFTTEILNWAAAPESVLEQIGAALRAGDLVGLPTETVYGLAANALDADAVVKIFEAKERPLFDPLIVHVRDVEQALELTHPSAAQKEAMLGLAAKFWPGPLTMVLPAAEEIPGLVTSGLSTVAVRCSAHPVMQAVMKAHGLPLAAPSANRFGRVSPTRAEHVFSELAGRIPWIVDAGPTTHGVESTIVQIMGDASLRLLRPGPVTAEQLGPVSVVQGLSTGVGPVAPGQLEVHYAPATPLKLASDPTASMCAGYLLFGQQEAPQDAEVILNMSSGGDLAEAAANLFQMLRELDSMGLECIVASPVPETGIGVAINDRLRRAAAKSQL